jgi:hypothetical protein
MIYEVGLFNHQTLLFSRQFYPIPPMENADNAHSALLFFIKKIAQDILDHQISYVVYESVRLFFISARAFHKNIENLDQIFVYAITDLSADKNIIQNLLIEAHAIFWPHLSQFDKSLKNKLMDLPPMSHQINRIFDDERRKPIDRIKKALFGELSPYELQFPKK